MRLLSDMSPMAKCGTPRRGLEPYTTRITTLESLQAFDPSPSHKKEQLRVLKEETEFMWWRWVPYAHFTMCRILNPTSISQPSTPPRPLTNPNTPPCKFPDSPMWLVNCGGNFWLRLLRLVSHTHTTCVNKVSELHTWIPNNMNEKDIRTQMPDANEYIRENVPMEEDDLKTSNNYQQKRNITTLVH